MFLIRSDHLIYNDFASNPLLNDLVIDFDDELGFNSAGRHSDQSNSPDCFTHAMVNDCSFGIPRSVFQTDTIIVSCGLANFEQSSWSTHRRPEFWGSCEELFTKEDCNKFVRSFEDKYPGKCDGRSISMIDCRKFDDLGNDKSLKEHIGRNPQIAKFILESENDHALHGRPYDGMYRFSLSKKHRDHDMQKCTSSVSCERRVMVEHVGLCRRHQHSVSLLYLSELDSWAKTCAGKCSECSKQSVRIFHDRVQAECSRHAPVPDPVTGRWKRSRPEHAESSELPAKDSLDGEDHSLQTSKKASDKCHNYASQDEHESRNLRRTCRAAREDLRQELVRCPVIFRIAMSLVKQTSQVHVSQIDGRRRRVMICNAGCHSHTKVSILRPHGTKVDVPVSRYREREKPYSRSETPSEKPWSRPRHRVRNLYGRRHQMTRRFRCRKPATTRSFRDSL